jgi:putative ABC transport system permease protein
MRRSLIAKEQKRNTPSNMTIQYTIRTALRGLQTNRTRSFLTILGIVIGITAIILISSLGQGAKNLILSQVQGLGSKTIAVLPGRQPKGPSDAAQLFSDSLKQKDLDALRNKANVPTLASIVPVVFGGDTAFYGNNAYRMTIFGASEEIQKTFDLEVAEGGFFTGDDVRSKAPVAVIGSKVKQELFGESDALGEKIKIKNHTFRIVGVLPKKGQSSFLNFDEAVMLPYTTAQDYIFGIKYFHRFITEASSDATIDQTARDVTLTLRESHGITDPEKDDFYVQTQADLANTIGTVTSVLTLFLASVASISLFVAGVGIMNIMLVSVTERTREIGLRKALGATEKNILQQFLLEAIFLTATGGIIGIILGTVFSFLASLAISAGLGVSWNFIFPFSAAVIGILVSALVGLVFGLYPARTASRKSPIEALRYE